MNRVLQLPLGASAPPVLEGYTLGDVLICKANRGKLLEVEHLVKTLQADVNYRNQHGCSALHGAAASGQLEVVQWMGLHSNVDWSATDHDDQTALHYAAFYGHLEVVQFLVENGVPLDAPDKFGRLAHCSAAINGHLDVVSYLLEECPSPIDINAVDEYGGTCLHWAASKGRKEVIQYLCMKGIDIHITSYDNKTAYQIAKDKHKQKCVQFLKCWYETSQKFVHAAEEGDDEEIARIIAEINGAYPLRFIRDKNGKNAMHFAAEFGHLSTLKLLTDHFDVWTDVDKFGRNALHSAALGGNKECAFWLIRKARDSSEFFSLTLTNKSPSRCAFEAGHSSLANYLQAWEEGNEDYSTNDEKSTLLLEVDAGRPVDDEAESVAPRSRNIETVYNWLKFFKMEEYAQNFEKDGFDTLRGVATIDENDLLDMKVKKGHRRVVLSHIEELRNQLQMLDENAEIAGMEPLSSPTLSMLSPFAKQSSLTSMVSAEGISHRTERRGSVTASPLPADV
ncbi:FOG: Ankyrin repeat [Plasmopara halstedii]|uniref:FOG: Ankyrin repeat n=1 Tax=Plasmopara halstedii TaxID=4781 RepID=A0A0P1APW0_PLAHL|nr:FOG: Ankyrin repeat [Plasmopara halstedii]CEG43266.1 FOG: Ankyrin repeat [Plasmopara halstedii]|eukprot:XP_024579635.1 FOG: Ankyrin repeat [Plasmopara halstedii]